MRQENDRPMALRRMESSWSCALNAEKARRTPPRKESREGFENRKPVSPSVMVSARPPVWCPYGSEPKRWAYIWLRPHGAKRDGIKVKSLPAKKRRFWLLFFFFFFFFVSGRRRFLFFCL